MSAMSGLRWVGDKLARDEVRNWLVALILFSYSPAYTLSAPYVWAGRAHELIGYVPTDRYQMAMMTVSALAPVVLICIKFWKAPEEKRKGSVYFYVTFCAVAFWWYSVMMGGYIFGEAQREQEAKYGPPPPDYRHP